MPTFSGIQELAKLGGELETFHLKYAADLRAYRKNEASPPLVQDQ